MGWEMYFTHYSCFRRWPQIRLKMYFNNTEGNDFSVGPHTIVKSVLRASTCSEMSNGNALSLTTDIHLWSYLFFESSFSGGKHGIFFYLPIASPSEATV